MAFSADGTVITSGSSDHTVRLWDAVTGSCKCTLRGDKQINCVAFSLDGKILAAGDGSYRDAGSVGLYDTVTGDVKSTLNGHSDEVNGVCFSPDGFKLASCSDDRSVKIWNLITRECVSTLSGHSDP